MTGAASGVWIGVKACQGRSTPLPEHLGGRDGRGRGDWSGMTRMWHRVAGTAGSNITGWPGPWVLFSQGRQSAQAVRDLPCRERMLGTTGVSGSTRMGTPASTVVPRTRVRCFRSSRADLPCGDANRLCERLPSRTHRVGIERRDRLGKVPVRSSFEHPVSGRNAQTRRTAGRVRCVRMGRPERGRPAAQPWLPGVTDPFGMS